MYGDNAKYIVINNGHDKEVPILFSSLIEHRLMQRHCGKAISAGFVNCNLQCFGESYSIGIKSRPDIDTRLVMDMFGTTEEDLKIQRE